MSLRQIAQIAALSLILLHLSAEEVNKEAEKNQSSESSEQGVVNQEDKGKNKRGGLDQMGVERITQLIKLAVRDQHGKAVPHVPMRIITRTLKTTSLQGLADQRISYLEAFNDVEKQTLSDDAGVVKIDVNRVNSIEALLSSEKCPNDIFSARLGSSWNIDTMVVGALVDGRVPEVEPGIHGIIHVHRYGKRTPLLEFESHLAHPGDGSMMGWGIFAGEKAPIEVIPADPATPYDFAVVTTRDPAAPLEKKLAPGERWTPYPGWRGDWQWEVTCLRGGIQQMADPTEDLAPVDGYRRTIRGGYTANDPTFAANSRFAWWWRRPGAPDTYIHIIGKIGINEVTGAVQLSFSQLHFDPAGGREVELPVTAILESEKAWIHWYDGRGTQVGKRLYSAPREASFPIADE